jgi:hypothetical protein
LKLLKVFNYSTKNRNLSKSKFLLTPYRTQTDSQRYRRCVQWDAQISTITPICTPNKMIISKTNRVSRNRIRHQRPKVYVNRNLGEKEAIINFRLLRRVTLNAELWISTDQKEGFNGHFMFLILSSILVKIYKLTESYLLNFSLTLLQLLLSFN